MREIKFRAWNSKNKKMLTDVTPLINKSTNELDYLITAYSACGYDMSELDCDYDSYLMYEDDEKMPYELMQYTGLKDVNDVEIYEGDVVYITDLKYGNKFKGVISFKNGSYVVESNIATHYRFIDYEIQVIGNIYENADLLEVSGNE